MGYAHDVKKVECWNDTVTDEGEISIWNLRWNEWKVTVNHGDGLFEQEELYASQAKENVLTLFSSVNANETETETEESGTC